MADTLFSELKKVEDLVILFVFAKVGITVAEKLGGGT